MAISLSKQIKTIFKTDFSVIRILLSQLYSGYLIDNGWFKSFKNKASVDKNNNPIPWLTYPFIDFLNERLSKEMKIFEYGSGNSTFYYSERVNSVTSIEHNKNWYDKILSKKSDNVILNFVPLVTNGKYCKSALESKIKFDIIIIDGEDRVNCINNCLNALTEDGVIILDDSERKEYSAGIDFLLKNSFKKIDFWGIAPGVLLEKCTTIFYKKNNCFNL